MGDSQPKYLSGPRSLGGTGAILTGTARPKIRTDVKFTIDPLNTPTCKSILLDASTSTSVNDFLQRWKIRDSGSDITLVSHDMKKNLNNFLTDLRSSTVDQGSTANLTIADSENKQIGDYLIEVAGPQITTLNLVNNCLREANTYNMDELNKQKDITSESKLRLESIKDPETKVSYYEGWFPLFRPISEPALFGIFATAVFLLLLSIGVFLRMSGFQLSITLPTFFISSGAVGTNYKPFIFIGLAVGIVGGIAYYGYEQGWFSKN